MSRTIILCVLSCFAYAQISKGAAIGRQDDPKTDWVALDPDIEPLLAGLASLDQEHEFLSQFVGEFRQEVSLYLKGSDEPLITLIGEAEQEVALGGRYLLSRSKYPDDARTPLGRVMNAITVLGHDNVSGEFSLIRLQDGENRPIEATGAWNAQRTAIDFAGAFMSAKRVREISVTIEFVDADTMRTTFRFGGGLLGFERLEITSLRRR